jgi:hypothetical protein
LRGLAGVGCGGGCVDVEGGGFVLVGLFLSAAPGFRSAAEGVEPGLYRSRWRVGRGLGTTPPGVVPGVAGVAGFVSGWSGSWRLGRRSATI